MPGYKMMLYIQNDPEREKWSGQIAISFIYNNFN